MARLPKLKNGLKGSIGLRKVALGLVLLVLAFGGYKALRVWRLVDSLQGHLDQLQAAADGTADPGLGGVGESLRGAHADLEALQTEVALFLPLTRFLGWLPGVGGDVREAPALLDVALPVAEAGVIAFDGLEPLVALTEGDHVGGQPMAQVVQALSDARPDLEAAQARLEVALERRSEVDDSALSARTAALIARLDRYLPLMQTAFAGGRVVPDLLGAAGRRTYFILAQNNDELRPTGGFISAVGVLILDSGEIVEITFADSYAVDDFTRPYPDSPAPILRYMGIDQWVFRDANWSPDFPTSAQKAVELYRGPRDGEVDGVVAVDQHALQAVTAALAPLEVEGWPEPVTGENVISLVRLAWSPDEAQGLGEWWRQRKSFMGDLFGAMQAKVETAPGQVKWLELARAVFRALDERHLQVWLADANGAIRQATSDYLLAVDTNMGYNKVNAIVQESLDYRLLISADGSAQATLTVRHVNPSRGEEACDPRPHYGADYDAMIGRCYWDYLRVYVPVGSRLFAATSHPVAANLLVTRQRQTGAVDILPEENGKAVFGSYFVLPHGGETETRFVYQLPPSTLEREAERWTYRLLVQKQAGTGAVPLRVTLVVPPGARVIATEVTDETRASGVAQRPEPNVVRFDADLARDRVFEVVFQYEP
jgi:hypothetical protein